MKKICLLFLMILGCGDGREANSQLDIVGGEVIANKKTERSSHSSAIGINDLCSGTRIADNLYMTAAHCAPVIETKDVIKVTASNSYTDKFVFVRNAMYHPSYKDGNSHIERRSDIALFSLEFMSVENKAEWDKYVTIAPIDYSFPAVGRDVVIAGIGCEEKFDFPFHEGLSREKIFDFWLAKINMRVDCTKQPNGQYMKAAKSKIMKMEDARYFILKGTSSDEGVTGFISNGDSGGPVFNTAGALLGVTSSASRGVIVANEGYGNIITYHVWTGYSENKSWIEEALSKKYNLYAPKDDLVSVEYPSGDLYYGSMVSGVRNGQGILTYKDGRIFDGLWANGQRSGEGSQSWPSEDPKFISYQGLWNQDKMNGRGLLKFKDGEIYEGEFKDNKYHGSGKRTLPNGDVREGTWVDGKVDGVSILTTSAGVKWREVYKDGKRTSAAKI